MFHLVLSWLQGKEKYVLGKYMSSLQSLYLGMLESMT